MEVVGLDFDRLHHVGVTVRDLDASLEWYRATLGFDSEFVATGSGEELSRALDCPGTSLRFAFVRLGNTILELLEYMTPEGADFELRNCDVGAAHIAIETHDLKTAFQELRQRGVVFTSGPIHIDEGPLAGSSFVYFRDPDGIQLELFESGSA